MCSVCIVLSFRVLSFELCVSLGSAEKVCGKLFAIHMVEYLFFVSQSFSLLYIPLTQSAIEAYIPEVLEIRIIIHSRLLSRAREIFVMLFHLIAQEHPLVILD